VFEEGFRRVLEDAWELGWFYVVFLTRDFEKKVG
jgi:hypothetical protein